LQKYENFHGKSLLLRYEFFKLIKINYFMKKLFILSIALSFCVLATYAQPRAIGLRIGANSAELTFHQLVNSQDNLLEIDFGMSWHNALQGALTYNWISSTDSGNWTTYAGFGIGGGYTWGDNSWYPKKVTANETNPTQEVKWFLRDYWTWGVAGLVGIEYKFPNFPLGISFDYRPLIGFDLGTKSNTGKFGVQYHVPGLWNFGIAARFMLM